MNTPTQQLGLATAILLTLLATGCARQDARTVTGEKSLGQVDVPDGWRGTTRLYPGATIQLHRGNENCYFVVIAEDMTEIEYDSDNKRVEELVPMVLANRKKKLTSFEDGPHRSLTINGLAAVQFEYQGVPGGSEKEPVAYVETLIEGSKHIFDILSWSTLDRMDKNRPKLDAVIATFREVESDGEGEGSSP